MSIIGALMQGITPSLPWLVPLVVVFILLRMPLPGRGPRSSRRDPWRTYKFDARRVVFWRAGGRCEGAAFIIWGRCSEPSIEADHVYPWSKGGPTVVSNGQALCRRHNRAKSNLTPAWWYLLGLERRRRAYFPAGEDVRVIAVMNDQERDVRLRALSRRRGGSDRWGAVP